MVTDKSGWVVGKVLAAQAAARGDSPFLQFQDGAPVTFGETDAIANRVANGLAALGVGKGDTVGVMLRNSLEFCYAWFGLSRAGAVHVAINTAYKGIYLEHVLSKSASLTEGAVNTGFSVLLLDRETVDPPISVHS